MHRLWLVRNQKIGKVWLTNSGKYCYKT